MTDEPDWFREELEPDIGPEERLGLWGVADLLIGARPFPSAALRAAVRRRSAGAAAGVGVLERPRGLWLRVAALAGPGVVLLAVVAVGLAGSGPFAK
jgi:hypothetical protein